MIQIHPVRSSPGPTFIGRELHDLRHMPSIGWTRLAQLQSPAVEGGSCDFGTQTLAAAYGEIIERRHFAELGTGGGYRVSVPLHQVCKPHEAALWRQALQIDSKEIDPGWILLPVQRIRDNQPAFVPEVVVSLSPHHPDRGSFPVSDSTGCGFHYEPALAYRSALLEFTERQSLIANWLSGSHRCEYLHSEAMLQHMPKHYQVLWEQIRRMGTCRVFEISLFESVSVQLALFQGNAGERVQFSVAASAGFTAAECWQSLMRELWQSIQFILSSPPLEERGGEEQMDIYQYQFFAANRTETVTEFKVWEEPVAAMELPVSDLSGGQVTFAEAARSATGVLGTVPQLEREILLIDPYVYRYAASEMQGGRPLIFFKIISPACFLHMSVPHLPCRNKMMDCMRLCVDITRKSKPLPFP